MRRRAGIGDGRDPAGGEGDVDPAERPEIGADLGAVTGEGHAGPRTGGDENPGLGAAAGAHQIGEIDQRRHRIARHPGIAVGKRLAVLGDRDPRRGKIEHRPVPHRGAVDQPAIRVVVGEHRRPDECAGIDKTGIDDLDRRVQGRIPGHLGTLVRLGARRQVMAEAKRDLAFDGDQPQFAGGIGGRARPDHPGIDRRAEGFGRRRGGADFPAADRLAEPAHDRILDLVGVRIRVRPARRRQLGDRLAAPRGAQQPGGRLGLVFAHLPLSRLGSAQQPFGKSTPTAAGFMTRTAAGSSRQN